MQHHSENGSPIQPVTVGLVVLGLIFAAEYAVMVALPSLLPSEPSRVLEAVVDSIVLTSLTAPAVWWMLVRPLQQAMTMRARFLAHALSSIEADRRHIAYELHDGVGQSLTLLVSGLKSLKSESEYAELDRRITALEQVAKTALKDVRKLSLGLRPSLLDDLGLAPAIQRIAAEFREHHPLEIAVDVEAIAGRRLAENVETALFRIVQESLTNVVKHSGAKRVEVKIEQPDGMIVVQVKDDGCGIDANVLNKLSKSPGHLGLIGMHERVTLLGGELAIESAPGQGTQIIARIPLPPFARPDARNSNGIASVAATACEEA